MENEQRILQIEKMKMAAELKMKQAIIDAQAAEMTQLRLDFAAQVKRADDNEEKINKILDGLDPKVY